MKNINNVVLAEYIWVDGKIPTKKLRSKTKVLRTKKPIRKITDIPEWSFDGSSTSQAETKNSDCILKPSYFIPDPIRGGKNILVLCEVYNADGKPHKTNTRDGLKKIFQKYKKENVLAGFEQEYTLYDKDGDRPYRWPAKSTAFPGPQGPYYCGIGADEVYGRELVEAHTEDCLKANIMIHGTNIEVMPAQAEFQIGPINPLELADQVWLARWLLYRRGEDLKITAKLDPKPISGDWNGAGAHTNFSTEKMRKPDGIKFIEEACRKLEKYHKEHIKVYGADNDKRLTGRHETCDINTFRWGVGDRGASIRIPAPVAKAGYGYLEDRRPAANADPYEVLTAMIETICGNGFKS